MQHHVGTHTRHMHISYAHSFSQRVYSLFLVPLGAVLLSIVLLHTLGHVQQNSSTVSLPLVFLSLCATLMRLCVAYTLALLFAIPLSLLVTHSRSAERIFLPLFDIMQSLPILAFFPVIIVFFVHYGLYNAAAIFVLTITMLWSIVFSMVGGLHTIPQDIKDAGTLFGLNKTQYVEKILLPASVPYLITGSLLAFAGGWNIIIVAEVLHTYVPGASTSADLFGIGSVLVNAAASGQEYLFFVAIGMLIITIAILNFFVWQKLLRYGERFKFE